MSPIRTGLCRRIQGELRMSGPVYNLGAGEIGRILKLARVPTGGGGDQGEFAEKSAHLKPPANSVRLVYHNPRSMTKDDKAKAGVQRVGLKTSTSPDLRTCKSRTQAGR
jgi:hypothetical protein